ncbi:MAG TPA: hypothetical protein VGI56_09505 [Galbitalea sp.]
MTEPDANESVRELLSELTEKDAEAVRPLLISLQSMAEGTAPAPSPRLAAALDANESSKSRAHRRLPHRGTIFVLALIGALAAGAGTAAAVSPEFRAGAAHAVAGILGATPYADHAAPHSTPSAPPTSHHSPGAPRSVLPTSHPTPSPSGSTHSNGEGKSAGHASPKSTEHPVPPATPPANGHGVSTP